MKKIIFSILTVILFLLILCFPQESFAAARAGLLLWCDTLVPTLLPIMILSRLLVDTDLAFRLAAPVSSPFSALLGITPPGVYALLTGFLCGCPMGVKVLADLRRNGWLSEAEAVYLAKFCNNISPSFLINFLVLGLLRSEQMIVPTLAILFGSPLLYGLLANCGYRKSLQREQNATADKEGEAFAGHLQKNKTSAMAISFAMVDACITDSICSITKLGGYITLFSVFAAMTDLLPLHAPLIRAILLGALEISGGTHRIAGLSIPFPGKYLLLIAASSFGGLCCAAQSAHMLSDIGLPMRGYLAAKLSITAIAVLMAVCYVG